jgi:competence protein ComFC
MGVWIMLGYFKNFTIHIQSLLAPIGVNCLTCGKRTTLLREAYGICEACYKAIPWILTPRCFRCGRGIGCPDCSRSSDERRYFIVNRSAVFYDKRMREWLAQYKYRGQERYAPLLIMMLDQAFDMMMREYQDRSLKHSRFRGNKDTKLEETLSWKIDIVTSVPVSEQRLVERGFNQAEVLGRGIALKRSIPYAELLIRERHSDKQSFKNRATRIKDMKDVFMININAIEKMIKSSSMYMQDGMKLTSITTPLRILLVDDIYTTGSTVNACSRILHRWASTIQIPIEVFSLTWARS